MAPKLTNASMDNKPQFVKILFQDPFANLMIPRKFHTNLPHKLQKLATLFSPSRKFWHVKLSCIDQDMYFQKGWSEFAKAHDLQTGDMMVFRYVGNMIFKVKVFDTTGCLKDYSLGSPPVHAPAYVEIETSSETRDQTSSKSSQEIKSGILRKRKSANEQALDNDKREKKSTSQMIRQEKKKARTSFNSTICSRQFERIIRRYCFSLGLLRIPKEFCVNNGLLTKRTIYLKTSSSGGRSWPVNFYLRALRGDLGKGWKEFREAAELKEGDRCIFRLVSQNSFVVDVIPEGSRLTRERKGKANEGSTSSDVALRKKQIQQPKQYARTIPEWEITVRQYHLTRSYQSLGRAFCLYNKLTSKLDMTLRDLTGKEWRVILRWYGTEGRLCSKGWTKFSSEYGLKVGDKCIFKIIGKDTLLVRIVKK